MPSGDEIFGGVEDLWKMGNRSKYGFCVPGTQAAAEATRYIENQSKISFLAV